MAQANMNKNLYPIPIGIIRVIGKSVIPVVIMTISTLTDKSYVLHGIRYKEWGQHSMTRWRLKEFVS